MTNLEKVEEIRRRALKEIIAITGVMTADMCIDISFYEGQGEGGNLFLEASRIDWLLDQHNESTWISSDEHCGTITVFGS